MYSWQCFPVTAQAVDLMSMLQVPMVKHFTYAAQHIALEWVLSVEVFRHFVDLLLPHRNFWGHEVVKYEACIQYSFPKSVSPE
jgi:hypothetical protein